MKILYFTSTGNSLHVAKKIGNELLSIPQLRKTNIYEINDDVVGIICPTYMLSIPRPVQNYLRNVKIKANYVFVILTYGNVQFGAIRTIRKLLEENGVQVHYTNIIQMVDNYLPMFEMSKEIKDKNSKEIDTKIDAITDDIKNRKQFILNPSLPERIFSKIYSSLSLNDKYMNKAVKKFFVNENCNGCETCKNVCPVGNIVVVEKPEYSNRCEFCLACIHNCPKNAIHLKNQKSNKRYINENIKLSEIINANKQN
jgi:ferredoxin